ncbi:hypothetical protein [Microbispora sp. CSR-4]|uniref:hypothetical protein n=1 Tax=Microbispora sp. CSR-4 TaxID=2592813 RepID=UPI00164FD939|nr:hypothetical protein [Microbispora sp. CSR-4]
MRLNQTQRSDDELVINWTREAIEALGPTTNVETAASVIGVSPWLVYELIRRGEWPVRALRLGRVIKIPTNDLIQWLYGGPDVAA